MISSELRQMVKEVPFRPFRIHMANGKSVDVPHPDFIFILHKEPLAIVERPDGVTFYVNLPIVTSVELLRAPDAA